MNMFLLFVYTVFWVSDFHGGSTGRTGKLPNKKLSLYAGSTHSRGCHWISWSSQVSISQSTSCSFWWRCYGFCYLMLLACYETILHTNKWSWTREITLIDKSIWIFRVRFLLGRCCSTEQVLLRKQGTLRKIWKWDFDWLSKQSLCPTVWYQNFCQLNRNNERLMWLSKPILLCWISSCLDLSTHCAFFHHFISKTYTVDYVGKLLDIYNAGLFDIE